MFGSADNCLLSVLNLSLFVISEFLYEVDEAWALLGYYAKYDGSSLPTFRDKLSFSSSRVKKYKKKSLDP